MYRSALNDREKNEEKAQIRPQKVLSQVVGGVWLESCDRSYDEGGHYLEVGAIGGEFIFL